MGIKSDMLASFAEDFGKLVDRIEVNARAVCSETGEERPISGEFVLGMRMGMMAACSQVAAAYDSGLYGPGDVRGAVRDAVNAVIAIRARELCAEWAEEMGGGRDA